MSPPAVVRRAVCGPPDPERRLPGHHSRTAEGPALPADYQLLRQGQGKRHACTRSGTHTWETGLNRDKSRTLSVLFLEAVFSVKYLLWQFLEKIFCFIFLQNADCL